MVTFVDISYQDSRNVLNFLRKNNEMSMLTHTSDNLRKSLLLTSASFFEDAIRTLLINFSKNKSSDSRLSSFLINGLIERRYDQFFNWRNGNVNNFMGLFGKKFLKKFQDDCLIDPTLKSASKSFIEIGSTRNDMIHNNLGSFFFQKTLDEVYITHQDAEKFLEYLKENII